MRLTSKYVATSGLLMLFLTACSPTYQGTFKTGDKADSADGGDGGGSGNPGLPGSEGGSPGKPETSAGAQINNKTFLALTDEEALHSLKEGEEQMNIICARHAAKNNIVTQAFCTNKTRPKSLVEFQQALGVAVVNGQTASQGNGGPGYAIQGHSSSLVGRFVSPINPRVILFRGTGATAIAVGFVRGEQLSEIAVRNADGSTDLFIAAFKQACNSAPGGCTPADTLTPKVETNWTSFTLYDDEDLKNTIVDCRHCHQPDGPSTPKVLRMQELQNPWTHWFRTNGNQPDDGVLIRQYQAAHGTAETYGGIPGNAVAGSDPADLETFLRNNGFANEPNNRQPNQFLTGAIAAEMGDQGRTATGRNTALRVYDEANCKMDKTKNSPSPSATWDALMYNFMNHTDACKPLVANGDTAGTAKTRRFIPPPYLRPFVADPGLLDKYTKQYQAFLAGTLDMSKFEDHREIFPADPKVTSQIGFAVDPDYGPEDILKLACSQCHHSDLDQSLSRAKFNALDFSKMPNLNQELDIAIARVKLGYSPERLKADGLKIVDSKGQEMEMHKGEHLLTMPPRRFRQLTDAQIDSLVKYFESKKKPQ